MLLTRKINLLLLLCTSFLVILAPAAWAQQRPYIGYVYPAGGQQGATFQIRLGGQGMDRVNQILVSGRGVSARLIECHRFLNNQELKLLKEQLQQLKLTGPATAQAPHLIAVLEQRIAEHVPRPACRSIATLVIAEISIESEAPPGEREIRLVTPRGVSNPLAFHVGQVPEFSRKPMLTAQIQVLGKETQALRIRPPSEVEDRITLPCTVNGQIASGEVNRYRFSARKGQQLVITTFARQLIPYIADAVPGWFQPVLALYDDIGKEVAYDDHYQFKPDPVVFYMVPRSGEYVLAIHDALYRGREDFIYRITIGELPFVTSIFPLGSRAGEQVEIKTKGWHLAGTKLPPPAVDATPGIYQLTTTAGGFISNRVPFALDTLPECFKKEGNHDVSHAQKVTLPTIINGRIDRPDEWDIFAFTGKEDESVVAEVYARRLDSPLDSVLKLTDSKGTIVAFNDDHEDLACGLNTHHADSYLMTKLPADGTYYLHIGDAARNGGTQYAYRLRISAPQPDFVLRVVPSSAALRSRGNTDLTVYAMRRDGFTAPITLSLKDPPSGFSVRPIKLADGLSTTHLLLKTSLIRTEDPINLIIEGRAQIGNREIAVEAVPAEDRMQAFLWRHLVAAQELKILVFNPTDTLVQPKRILPDCLSPSIESALKSNITTASPATPEGKPRLTKQQATARLKELIRLYEEGLLTDDFYCRQVKGIEAIE